MIGLKPGTPVIVARRLGEVVRPARLGPAHGYDVLTAPEPHEGHAPHWAPDWVVKVAQVGVNVCAKPSGACWCGLVHVTHPERLA